MKRSITGFHQDLENDWVVELECGHGQRVHDPSWTEREWATSPEGRASRLGQELDCHRCREQGLRVAAAVVNECRLRVQAEYERAGVSGLCAEGRWEAALAAFSATSVEEIMKVALEASDA